MNTILKMQTNNKVVVFYLQKAVLLKSKARIKHRDEAVLHFLLRMPFNFI